jgi:hypothetical protein
MVSGHMTKSLTFLPMKTTVEEFTELLKISVRGDLARDANPDSWLILLDNYLIWAPGTDEYGNGLVELIYCVLDSKEQQESSFICITRNGVLKWLKSREGEGVYSFLVRPTGKIPEMMREAIEGGVIH